MSSPTAANKCWNGGAKAAKGRRKAVQTTTGSHLPTAARLNRHHPTAPAVHAPVRPDHRVLNSEKTPRSAISPSKIDTSAKNRRTHSRSWVVCNPPETFSFQTACPAEFSPTSPLGWPKTAADLRPSRVGRHAAIGMATERSAATRLKDPPVHPAGAVRRP